MLSTTPVLLVCALAVASACPCPSANAAAFGPLSQNSTAAYSAVFQRNRLAVPAPSGADRNRLIAVTIQEDAAYGWHVTREQVQATINHDAAVTAAVLSDTRPVRFVVSLSNRDGVARVDLRLAGGARNSDGISSAATIFDGRQTCSGYVGDYNSFMDAGFNASRMRYVPIVCSTDGPMTFVRNADQPVGGQYSASVLLQEGDTYYVPSIIRTSPTAAFRVVHVAEPLGDGDRIDWKYAGARTVGGAILPLNVVATFYNYSARTVAWTCRYTLLDAETHPETSADYTLAGIMSGGDHATVATRYRGKRIMVQYQPGLPMDQQEERAYAEETAVDASLQTGRHNDSGLLLSAALIGIAAAVTVLRLRARRGHV